MNHLSHVTLFTLACQPDCGHHHSIHTHTIGGYSGHGLCGPQDLRALTHVLACVLPLSPVEQLGLCVKVSCVKPRTSMCMLSCGSGTGACSQLGI